MIHTRNWLCADAKCGEHAYSVWETIEVFGVRTPLHFWSLFVPAPSTGCPSMVWVCGGQVPTATHKHTYTHTHTHTHTHPALTHTTYTRTHHIHIIFNTHAHISRLHIPMNTDTDRHTHHIHASFHTQGVIQLPALARMPPPARPPPPRRPPMPTKKKLEEQAAEKKADGGAGQPQVCVCGWLCVERGVEIVLCVFLF